ncbi:MAG: tryptophan--tRNA ligase [Candidatus Magasanikbacteria bacterium]|nr:tryptophan--tRNA ligase [Candidatus Magasanikbacteria bacterium]
MPKPIVLSGIQPTGNLHVGNYLGALQNIVKLQNLGDYQMYYFIADWHSLTGEMTAAERRRQIMITAAELVALGLEPEQLTLFVQSHLPEHTELGWVLSTVTPMALLQRMTQFKDKAEQQTKNINAGLFNYPVLQAADILLYHATLVPVGEDQAQHLEFTNDIVRAFNRRYGDYFAPIKPLFTKTARVMSLLAPEKKMSKSLGADHVLELADEPKAIERKLKRAVTATAGGGKSPGAANLLELLQAFAPAKIYQEFAEAERQGNIRYSELKQALAAAVSDYFSAFRKRRAELLASPRELPEILAQGAERARSVAAKTIAEIRRLVGVR